MSLVVYTAAELAELLRCSPGTVEDLARKGVLAGLKPGREWIFPAGAVAQGLDALAAEEAAARRGQASPPPVPSNPAPAAPLAIATAAAPIPTRRGGPRRPLPRLVDVRGGN